MRRPIPLGKYLLLDRIAVGGMAEVFAGKTSGAAGFERIVAIKRILPNMVEDEEFITMFIDEARIAARLTHGNIVQIHELGQHEDTWYMAMEYVSGRDARSIIEKFRRRKEAVPVPLAVFIVARVAEGLDYAHRKKDLDGRDLDIIHRDISPQNVLVSYEGEVKIIDFGIAKAAGRVQKTQAGVLKGKFGYMSPEQVRGLDIDHRSDIFSAGVMLYEMATGTRLFTSDSDLSTLERVRAGEIRPPSEVNPEVPPALERIMLKALAREREERYQRGDELAEELLRFLYSSEKVYTTRALAGFMKETFSEELRREQERLRRWLRASEEDEASRQPAPEASPRPVVRVRSGIASPVAPPGPAATPKVRIGPPSSFDTGELRLEDSTTIAQPFADSRREVSPPAGLPPPPVDDEMTAGAAAPIALATSGRVQVATPVGRPTPDDPVVDDSTPRPARKAAVPPSAGPSRPPARRLARPAAIALAALAILAVGLVFALRQDAPATGSIIVDLDPRAAGARIELAGEVISEDPPFSRRLPAGEHRLIVTANGFEPHEGTFAISADAPLDLTVKLERRREEAPEEKPPGVEPPAAMIAQPVAEEEEPAAPAPAPREPPRPVVADHPARAPAAARPAVANEAPAPVAEAKAAAATGELLVFSTPPGAMVVLDGRSIGPTPQKVPDLAGGRSVSLKLSLDGHLAATRTVKVPAGGRERVMVKLDPEPTGEGQPMGSLVAICTPPARVFVDGKDSGRYTPIAPNKPLEIEPGRHTIACVTENGRKEREVVVAPGEMLKFIETVD